MSTSGHSWRVHARPPLPITMWTERAVGVADAANATSLPAVPARISKILLRETPSAAPAATVHLISARRERSCCSARTERGCLAMGGLLLADVGRGQDGRSEEHT